MVITGNSGSEFGIVGEVQARDALTGETVWTRPGIEGHMEPLKKQSIDDDRDAERDLAGRCVEDRGAATWLGG
jgi:alcohol dehydrogenase (cytochrome c)